MSNSLTHIADACEKPLGLLARWMFYLSLVVLALMSLPIAVDIVGRVLHDFPVTGVEGLDGFFAGFGPLTGVIEIEELVMVLLLFLSLPRTQIYGTHINIDFLAKKFNSDNQLFLNVMFQVMMAGFLIIAGYWAIRQGMMRQNNMTPELFIKIWPFLYFVGVSMFITALAALCAALRAFGQLAERGLWLRALVALLIGAAIITCPFWLAPFKLRFDRFTLGVAGWLLMLVLLFLGLPLGFAMGISGMLGLCLLNKKLVAGLAAVGFAPYQSMLSFVLVSVPLFILMGEITSKSGISRDLFRAASIWLGRMPGGLAVASVAGCAGFAAICGESLPTAVTMSSVALPEMQRLKYDDSLACGGLAAGGTLGILIPPSIGFIFYSVVTEQSVGMLFMAGLIPGLLMAGLFMLVIVVTAVRQPHKAPSAGKTSWSAKFGSLNKVIGFAIIFLIIVLGIMTGIMNPTEASAFGAIGALLVALAMRRLTLRLFVESLVETIKISSRLLFIMAGVGILGQFLALTHLPTDLGLLIRNLPLSPYVILLLIICIWVALGCVMNVIPMILLTLPAIFPTVEMLGFNPIWFGVIAVVVMEMGQLTPPVGIVCFAVSSVGGVPLEKVFRGILPFFLCMWVVVILLIIFPELATWLPDMLFGKK